MTNLILTNGLNFFQEMGFQLCKVIFSDLFGVFFILVLGYLLGRIVIKGVSLGSAGVFIIALVVGIIIKEVQPSINEALQSAFGTTVKVAADGTTKVEANLAMGWMTDKGAASTGFTMVKNIGLALFVTSVGLIAGPKFFRNFKSKAVAYIALGAIIVASATLCCVVITLADNNLDPATATGLLMGSLTSTPGFSAAQIVFDAQKQTVSAANGAAYPFGVLGVVFFVQIMPKIMRADMNKERALLLKVGAPKSANIDEPDQVNKDANAGEGEQVKKPKKLFELDKFGLCIFAVTVILGYVLGSISLKFSESIIFNLTSTGGFLIIGLIFGHFGKIGRLSLKVPDATLKVFREFGLVLFLTGSGFEGGLKFLELVSANPLVFLYGVIMTLIPMVIGFIVAKFGFKLCLLNNLGSITGGMTSTPALGSLINVAETEDVASAYAATYPIALILLVFVPQIMALL